MKSHFLKKTSTAIDHQLNEKRGGEKNHKIALPTQLALELTATLPWEANAQSINGNVNVWY